jgi:hypothetical protein
VGGIDEELLIGGEFDPEFGDEFAFGVEDGSEDAFAWGEGFDVVGDLAVEVTEGIGAVDEGGVLEVEFAPG